MTRFRAKTCHFAAISSEVTKNDTKQSQNVSLRGNAGLLRLDNRMRTRFREDFLNGSLVRTWDIIAVIELE